MQQKMITYVFGVDLSHWNGTINFDVLKKSGVKFAYLKTSDGYTYEDGSFKMDSQFINYAKNAMSAGIHTGGYHFARPQRNYANAEAEAQFFIDSLQLAYGKGKFGYLMPVLDLESPAIGQSDGAGLPQNAEGNITLTSEQLLIWAWRFKTYFQNQTGVKLMLYTGKWFYWDFYKIYPNANVLLDMPLWVSSYTASAPTDFSGWKHYTIWQYTDNINIPGTIPSDGGNIDGNYAISLEAIKSREVEEHRHCNLVSGLIGVGLGFGAGYLIKKRR